MKQDVFGVTSQKLFLWLEGAKISKTAWELRRIFSQSSHLDLLAQYAMKKDKKCRPGMTWNEWWGYRLEKIPEVEAVNLLFTTWQNEVRSHLMAESKKMAFENLSEILDDSYIAHVFVNDFESWTMAEDDIGKLISNAKNRSSETPEE